MSKRIFVVEDDENIRELVRVALGSFGHEVQAFETAEDALAAIAAEAPNLVIFDIMLPGVSGLEAVKRLRETPATQTLPVILLTAKDTEMDKVAGLDCGADDYIAKPFGVMELGARVRALLRRAEVNAPMTAPETAITDLIICHQTREVTRGGQPLDLTYKEYEVLCLLIRERDRIVPREELLQSIWGTDFIGESRTLDMHIRTLRQKLGDDAEYPHYIKTIRTVGYRFIGE